MRYFRFYSKSCVNYKQAWIGTEDDLIKEAREHNQDTPLEVYAGIKWDEEADGWERALSHDEAVEVALRVNHFGDYLITEVEPQF
jgi:hypothetical protein